eukprot:scaffold546_cov163-Amphora_coffeaeformis.AAC.13
MKAGRCGRKPNDSIAETIGKEIEKIPSERRSTIRDLAEELDMPTTTIHRLIQKDVIVPHSSHVKPILTE